jgi:prevent-host-death family protein
MHTISATEIKQNSVRLQEALRDDILITKRDKPFVVVIDYEKYKKFIENSIESTEDWDYWSDNEIDNFGKISIGLSNHDYDDEDEDYSQW